MRALWVGMGVRLLHRVGEELSLGFDPVVIKRISCAEL